MKSIIKKSQNHELEFLLRGSLYESLYAKIKEVLNRSDDAFFFCKIERRKTECLWYGEEGYQYRSLPLLGLEDKILVSDLLQATRSRLDKQLKNEKLLAENTETLFVIPADEDIYLVTSPAGKLGIAITRWGFQSAQQVENMDPLTKLINIPRPEHYPVQLAINYSDGSLYKEQPFYFLYSDNATKRFQTNASGQFYLGKLKNGRQFKITQFDNDDGSVFTVTKDQELYHAVFPYFINFNILVVDQDEIPLPRKKIVSTYNGTPTSHLTNEEGVVEVLKLELLNLPYELSSEQGKIKASYQLDKDTQQLVFKITEARYGDVSIHVVDQEHQAYSEYPLQVSIDEEPLLFHKTDEKGSVKLGAVEVGKTIHVKDAKDSKNEIKEVVSEGENILKLQVERIIETPVKVRLIGYENEAIASAPIEFKIGTKDFMHNTDEEGWTYHNKDLFTDQEKVKTKIHLKKKNGKDKIVAKSFQYDSKESEYTLSLRKRNWWWLLLLLLPLLLLIECEKSVHIETVNAESNRAIPNVEIQLSYNRYSLFDKGKFFAQEKKEFNTQTDSLGNASIEKMSYTLYSVIFKYFHQANITAINHCYHDDKANRRFHGIKNGTTIKLSLSPIPITLPFRVVDATDDQPLPDVLIEFKSNYNGSEWSGKHQSNANGNFNLEDIAKCGILEKLRASLNGYFTDSLINQPIETLLNNSGKEYIIRLKPIKELVSFHVVNCFDKKQKIPSAKATIEYIGKNKSQKDWIKTNTDGLGKTNYHDSLWVLNKIKIVVEKRHYKKGINDEGLTVKQFMELPDSLRTICLEPLKQTLTFLNIDEVTKSKLSGVTNIIKIINSRGESRNDTLLSNTDGAFLVANVIAGDKISIHSSLDPYYESNDYSIQKRDVIPLIEGPQTERVIPLKPKEFEIDFWTVEKESRKNWIANADLVVTKNGTVMAQPNNSGTGKFSIKATLHSNISIKASKQGRITNDTTIVNEKVSLLINSPRSEREIPMECGFEPVEDANVNYYKNEFELNQASGQFKFEYYTDTQADSIKVYCGRKHNTSANNILFTYGKATGSERKIEIITISNCKFITVEVKGSSNWDYKIYCPE